MKAPEVKVFKYKYIGTEEVEIPGLGLIQPGGTIESPDEINHPLFELVNGESVQSKK